MEEKATGFTIKTITAFVAIGNDGEEGVMGQLVQNVMMPFVCADEIRLQILLPLALKISKDSGIPFRVLQFSTRSDITDQLLGAVTIP